MASSIYNGQLSPFKTSSLDQKYEHGSILANTSHSNSSSVDDDSNITLNSIPNYAFNSFSSVPLSSCSMIPPISTPTATALTTTTTIPVATNSISILPLDSTTNPSSIAFNHYFSSHPPPPSSSSSSFSSCDCSSTMSTHPSTPMKPLTTPCFCIPSSFSPCSSSTSSSCTISPHLASTYPYTLMPSSSPFHSSTACTTPFSSPFSKQSSRPSSPPICFTVPPSPSSSPVRSC